MCGKWLDVNGAGSEPIKMLLYPSPKDFSRDSFDILAKLGVTVEIRT